MNKFQLFILVLLSSSITVNACGYYPYGEDIRYCFFKPEYYGFDSFSEFYYSSNTIEPRDDVYTGKEVSPNEQLWFNYCKGKVPAQAIRMAVYQINARDFNKSSQNEMIQYLYTSKDTEAINYLKFAKKCELLNQFYEDPWERNDELNLPQRTNLYNEAYAMAGKTINKELKLRYTFLAIRMAFYNQQFDKIKMLHNTFFAQAANKDILYYWSLYFNTLFETDKPLANFYAAQVFANAPDKRFAIKSSFDMDVPLNDVLKYAKTDTEKANVYLLAGIKKTDRALENLQAIYKNNSQAQGLSFLLLREINKIEDWVYTPYYSLFEPSMRSSYNDDTQGNIKRVLNRVEADRSYAGEVLNFINSADLNKVNNAQFWVTAKAQLEFITRQYNNSLATIEGIDKKNLSADEGNQLDMIKALALISLQKQGSAIVLENVKPILLKNKRNNKFLFALARELEYKGNTDDAALLYSKLSESGEDFDAYYNSNNSYWKSKQNPGYAYEDYFSDYFGYINMVYTPQQITSLIKKVQSNTAADEFSVWEYSVLKNQESLLYDLLGTKYIRKNNLAMALQSFGRVSQPYWKESYALVNNKDEYYGNEFDKNPFYQIKYTPDFITVKDTTTLTKYTVTKQLIDYTARANNASEKDKDYYYFLVANCYYNMSHYGNSWMMRRFSWSSFYSVTMVEDEKEFKETNLAKQYYTLAYKHAKTKKFRALCLRMIALCDTNKNEYATQDDSAKYDVSIYYKQLRKKYPAYYKDLTSNCSAFGDYFKARR